jgi:hypothetical protein
MPAESSPTGSCSTGMGRIHPGGHLLRASSISNRAKIEPDPPAAYILTEPGVGYRLQ